MKEVARSASKALEIFLSDVITTIAAHILLKLEGSTETEKQASYRGNV